MSFFMRAFFLAATLPGAARAVPSFDINLDLPPEQRFAEVTEFYSRDMLAMIGTLNNTLSAKYSQDEIAQWVQVLRDQALKYFPDYLAELQGIVNVLHNPVATMDVMLLFNGLYELASPTLCSGLLVASEDGQVIHGRNMDYTLIYTLSDGTVRNLPDITHDQVYWRKGKKLMTLVGWPLYTGAHTGMRFDGWTFEQNTRSLKNDATANLAEAQKGGVQFAWRIRHLMETVPTFEEALLEIEATDFMAPQYFIMSGAGPFEAAVISVDRGGKRFPDTPPVQRMSQQAGVWHLLQTNDDVSKLPMDLRRPLTNFLLDQQSQSAVSTDFVWQMIRSPTIFQADSVFTWVASPKTGYYHTIIHSESPPAEAEEMIFNTPEDAGADLQELQLHQNDHGKALHRPRSKWAQRATSGSHGVVE